MMSLKRGYNEESLWSSEQPPTKKVAEEALYTYAFTCN